MDREEWWSDQAFHLIKAVQIHGGSGYIWECLVQR
jgi:hypothetical protein